MCGFVSDACCQLHAAYGLDSPDGCILFTAEVSIADSFRFKGAAPEIINSR